MTRKLINIIAGVVAVIGLAVVPVMATTGAANATAGTFAAAKDQIESGYQAAGGSSSDDLDSVLGNVINIMLFIVGFLAVVMIVFGGIRYVTSAGDQNRVTAAKNTIMYSIIGLVIAVLAYAIINWVLDLF